MEADWEFEIASDAPVIDAAWAGYTDLRLRPEQAAQLPETAKLPALADVLESLNKPGSPVWTSKCDVWEPGAIDPYELEATQDQAQCALSCYIDLLSADELAWSTHDGIADWCRRLCARLRPSSLRQCRVDLVIRRAFPDSKQSALGITAYVTGCGATVSQASDCLSAALRYLAAAIPATELRVESTEKLQ